MNLILPALRPRWIEDQQPPAPVVPADLRAGQVDRAERFFASGLVAEKRACVGEDFKDTFVFRRAAILSGSTATTVSSPVYSL